MVEKSVLRATPRIFFFQKLTPISCNLGHSVIIFMSFSTAIFLGNFASESSISLKYNLSKVWLGYPHPLGGLGVHALDGFHINYNLRH